MNILVTAIGSMSAQTVLEQLSRIQDSFIIGTDIYPQSWQVNLDLVTKFYQLPKAVEESYINEILKICNTHGIKYLIPLTDPEVDVLSANRIKFENNNIVLCISGKETITKCRDKIIVEKDFKNISSVNVIPSYSKEEINDEAIYPIIAKPKNGRSSEGLYMLKNNKWLTIIENKDDYIFQPYIQGQVITVDVIREKNGKSVSIARKELTRTSNGAGLTVEVIKKDAMLEHSITTIIDELNIVGCVNLEFLQKDNTYYLMDINPRFSAGVGFSLFAGYDFVINHLRCFQDEPIADLLSTKEGILSKKSKIIIL